MSRKEKKSSETMYSEFATRLRDLMADRGINQRQLAISAGVSRQTINNYVLGQSVPKGDSLKKLSDVLGVSVDYLQGVSDVENPDSTIQGAVQCTGLDEDAINHLISLEPYQKDMASDIIRSPSFIKFIDAFSETFVRLRDSEHTADAVLEMYDDSTSLSELEFKASLYTDLCSAERVLLGSKYGVIDAAIKLLNDILDLDNTIEEIEHKRRSFNSKALMDRIAVLSKERRQQNGLD